MPHSRRARPKSTGPAPTIMAETSEGFVAGRAMAPLLSRLGGLDERLLRDEHSVDVGRVPFGTVQAADTGNADASAIDTEATPRARAAVGHGARDVA